MHELICRWLPIIFGCHCRKDRSFHRRGKPFPICARCTGELAGMTASLLICSFAECSLTFSALLMIPMITDGFLQLKTDYESSNLKRFLTGSLFGYALINFVISTTVTAFEFGLDLAHSF